MLKTTLNCWPHVLVLLQFSVHKYNLKWKNFPSIVKVERASILYSPFNASAHSGFLSPGCSVGIPRGFPFLMDADSGDLASEPNY